MQKQKPDWAKVYDHHKWVHERLINWARWVTPGSSAEVSPMFRDYRSHAWQWHPREHRPECNVIEAQEVESFIAKLPPTHREVLRWCYVRRYNPAKASRNLRLDYAGMERHIHDGRSMLDLALRGSKNWCAAVMYSGESR